MIEMKEEQERAILVAVDTGEYDAAVSLDELEELAQSGGHSGGEDHGSDCHCHHRNLSCDD